MGMWQPLVRRLPNAGNLALCFCGDEAPLREKTCQEQGNITKDRKSVWTLSPFLGIDPVRRSLVEEFVHWDNQGFMVSYIEFLFFGDR